MYLLCVSVTVTSVCILIRSNLLLLLLLLFCFIYHSGTSTIPVRGKKGGDATLTCGYEAREISDIRFIHHRKRIHFAVIPVCLNEEDKHEHVRVCKKEACDVVIKDLIFSDAGKYIFRFNYRNALTELKYQLHIYGKVKTDQTISMRILDFLILWYCMLDCNHQSQ